MIFLLNFKTSLAMILIVRLPFSTCKKPDVSVPGGKNLIVFVRLLLAVAQKKNILAPPKNVLVRALARN
jgi:hypothetical protein